MKTYTVTVNFAGYIGCDEEYEVYADSIEDAEYRAIQEAISDLCCEVVEESEDEDYE